MISLLICVTTLLRLLSHLIYLLLRQHCEKFGQEEPLEDAERHADAKEDQVGCLGFDLRADHRYDEDKERLKELEHGKWCRLRYELEPKKAIQETVDAGVLHTPRQGHDDAEVECELVDGCVKDEHHAGDRGSNHVDKDLLGVRVHICYFAESDRATDLSHTQPYHAQQCIWLSIVLFDVLSLHSLRHHCDECV